MCEYIKENPSLFQLLDELTLYSDIWSDTSSKKTSGAAISEITSITNKIGVWPKLCRELNNCIESYSVEPMK